MQELSNSDKVFAQKSAGEIATSIQITNKLDSKTARIIYEALITKSNGRELLREIARNLIKCLGSGNGFKNKPLYIMHENRCHIFRNRSVITVGRIPENDLVIDNKSVSRLHLVIFIFETDIYVIDFASAFGTKTLKRSSDKECINVIKENQNVLSFSTDEAAILNLADREILTLSPRECIVCLKNLRQVIYSCDHFVACDMCTENIKKTNNQCPLCREQIAFTTTNLSKIMILIHG